MGGANEITTWPRTARRADRRPPSAARARAGRARRRGRATACARVEPPAVSATALPVRRTAGTVGVRGSAPGTADGRIDPVQGEQLERGEHAAVDAAGGDRGALAAGQRHAPVLRARRARGRPGSRRAASPARRGVRVGTVERRGEAVAVQPERLELRPRVKERTRVDRAPARRRAAARRCRCGRAARACSRADRGSCRRARATRPAAGRARAACGPRPNAAVKYCSSDGGATVRGA